MFPAPWKDGLAKRCALPWRGGRSGCAGRGRLWKTGGFFSPSLCRRRGSAWTFAACWRSSGELPAVCRAAWQAWSSTVPGTSTPKPRGGTFSWRRTWRAAPFRGGPWRRPQEGCKTSPSRPGTPAAAWRRLTAWRSRTLRDGCWTSCPPGENGLKCWPSTPPAGPPPTPSPSGARSGSESRRIVSYRKSACATARWRTVPGAPIPPAFTLGSKGAVFTAASWCGRSSPPSGTPTPWCCCAPITTTPSRQTSPPP